MTGIAPTLEIKETSRNVGDFIKNHKEVFWNIVKPLLPWIVGLYAIDIFVTVVFMPESKNGFSLGSIVANYFYTALVISWHRVVIHGPENAVPMNPFKPQKHELIFLGMGVLLGLAAFVVGFIIGGGAFFIHPALGIAALLILMPLGAYIGYRLSFYFPAKAVNNSITFKKAFSLTKGYFWKLMGASFMASVKYILGIFVFFILVFIVLTILGFILGSIGDNAIIQGIFGLIFSIPVLAYFYPLIIIVGVTTLSNYYLYALQNKT